MVERELGICGLLYYYNNPCYNRSWPWCKMKDDNITQAVIIFVIIVVIYLIGRAQGWW